MLVLGFMGKGFQSYVFQLFPILFLTSTCKNNYVCRVNMALLKLQESFKGKDKSTPFVIMLIIVFSKI